MTDTVQAALEKMKAATTDAELDAAAQLFGTAARAELAAVQGEVTAERAYRHGLLKRKALREALIEAGCRARLVNGATAALADRPDIHVITDDGGERAVMRSDGFIDQPIEGFAKAWLAGDGRAFASAPGGGPGLFETMLSKVLH